MQKAYVRESIEYRLRCPLCGHSLFKGSLNKEFKCPHCERLVKIEKDEAGQWVIGGRQIEVEELHTIQWNCRCGAALVDSTSGPATKLVSSCHPNSGIVRQPNGEWVRAEKGPWEKEFKIVE